MLLNISLYSWFVQPYACSHWLFFDHLYHCVPRIGTNACKHHTRHSFVYRATYSSHIIAPVLTQFYKFNMLSLTWINFQQFMLMRTSAMQTIHCPLHCWSVIYAVNKQNSDRCHTSGKHILWCWTRTGKEHHVKHHREAPLFHPVALT